MIFSIFSWKNINFYHELHAYSRAYPSNIAIYDLVVGPFLADQNYRLKIYFDFFREIIDHINYMENCVFVKYQNNIVWTLGKRTQKIKSPISLLN